MTAEQQSLKPMELDEEKARELEEKFDSEIRFRPLLPVTARIVGALLIILSLFHYYTAGFGILSETMHRAAPEWQRFRCRAFLLILQYLFLIRLRCPACAGSQ